MTSPVVAPAEELVLFLLSRRKLVLVVQRPWLGGSMRRTGWFILKPALNRPFSCKPAQAVKPGPLVNRPPVPIRAMQG